jgi:hypothetical protein
MAYLSKDLSVLAYANGFTLWHYTTSDASATVDAGGYFNAAVDMLRSGDIIIANVDASAAPHAALFLVSAASGGAVTVNDMTKASATDSN